MKPDAPSPKIANKKSMNTNFGLRAFFRLHDRSQDSVIAAVILPDQFMANFQFSILALLIATAVVAITVLLSGAGLLGPLLTTAGVVSFVAMFFFAFESSTSSRTVATDAVSIFLLAFLLFVILYAVVLITSKMAHS